MQYCQRHGNEMTTTLSDKKKYLRVHYKNDNAKLKLDTETHKLNEQLEETMDKYEKETKSLVRDHQLSQRCSGWSLEAIPGKEVIHKAPAIPWRHSFVYNEQVATGAYIRPVTAPVLPTQSRSQRTVVSAKPGASYSKFSTASYSTAIDEHILDRRPQTGINSHPTSWKRDVSARPRFFAPELPPSPRNKKTRRKKTDRDTDPDVIASRLQKLKLEAFRKRCICQVPLMQRHDVELMTAMKRRRQLLRGSAHPNNFSATEIVVSTSSARARRLRLEKLGLFSDFNDLNQQTFE